MNMKNCGRYIILVLFATLSYNSYGQFTINNTTTAESIITKPEMKVEDKYDFKVVNAALLRKQRRDEFNRKNYYEFNTALLFSQSGYTNWAAGGKNTFNGRTTAFIRHVYSEKKISNDVYFNAAYGLGNQDDKLWKTEDRLEINNLTNYQLHKKWKYSVGVNFKSQFTNGYASIDATEPSSHFMAPGTVNLSGGISYVHDVKRMITISPISGNMVIVNDPRLSAQGAYGVDPGEKYKTQFGAYINILWEQPIIKNVMTYRTTAQSFYDYKSTPTLNWQSWLDVKIVKYLSVNFNCTLMFNDKVVTPKGGFWQFSEVLGFGVTYVFKNKEKP